MYNFAISTGDKHITAMGLNVFSCVTVLLVIALLGWSGRVLARSDPFILQCQSNCKKECAATHGPEGDLYSVCFSDCKMEDECCDCAGEPGCGPPIQIEKVDLRC